MAGQPLGDRMKAHEFACRPVFPRRIPIVIRVDGRAFHTLTRRCDRPFDRHFMRAMDKVGLGLCAEIQGAKLAYIQSDEVSVLVHGYDTIQTEPWFGNDVQKIVSVSASVATQVFLTEWEAGGAHFDARAFLMPEDEVCNYFIWRQQDAVRNSINMVGQSYFSQAQMHGKSGDEVQEMLHQATGVNWGAMPARLKRGRCAVRSLVSAWEIDDEIPTFTTERAYINRHLEKDMEVRR
jgi:tRNA(His) guanylyltransferase